jgi:hypothetical protein
MPERGVGGVSEASDASRPEWLNALRGVLADSNIRDNEWVEMRLP